jgi:hypothetical protein
LGERTRCAQDRRAALAIAGRREENRRVEHPQEEVLMTRDWERIGAVSGILFFVAVVASFFTPETPDADDPTAEIVRSIADDRSAHLVSVYLQGLGALLFLVFVGALWARLRRAEADRGPSILVALGGVGTAVIILISSGVFLALIEAADEGREPAAVRALFELDEMLFIVIGWTSAAFYAGAALSSLPTGSLPRSLSRVAAGLATLLVVGLLGIFSEADDGGVLGVVFFVGVLVNFLWILATSIVMLRTEGR